MNFNFIKYWSVFIVVFFACNYYALGQREQLLPIQIKENRIDSCTISKEVQKNDSIQKNILATFKYNTNGDIVNGYHYKNVGELSHIEKYKYDKQGNIIEKVMRDFPNTTIKAYDSTTEWGKRAIEELRFHNKHIKHKYVYDTINNLIKEEAFVSSFETPVLTKKHSTHISTYSYNTSGYLDTKIEVWPSRKKNRFIEIDSTFFMYNEKGKIIKKVIKEYEEDLETHSYFYNKHGKKIKEEHRYGVDTNPYVFYYEYDSLMNNISIKEYDKDNILYAHYFYKYSDTLVVEYKFRENDGDYFIDRYYTYDSLSRKKKITNITLEGNRYIGGTGSSYIKKPIYDTSGTLKTEKRYWKRVKPKRYQGKTDYFYNKQGQVSYEKEYDKKENLLKIKVYEYNNKNQAIQATEFDKDSILNDTELRYYDSKGTKYARKLINPDGEVALYQTYTYDDEGIETGGVFFNRGRKEVIKQYRYNKNGTYKTIHVIEKNWDIITDKYVYKYEYY